jgi:hypothetical protein
MYYCRKGRALIIWLPRWPRTPEEYGTLAHEVGHVVRCLCGWAGIEINEDTDEVLCHGLKHGVKSVLEARPR